MLAFAYRRRFGPAGLLRLPAQHHRVEAGIVEGRAVAEQGVGRARHLGVDGRPVRRLQHLFGQGKEDLVLGLQVQPVGLDEALDQAGQDLAMDRLSALRRLELLRQAMGQAR